MITIQISFLFAFPLKAVSPKKNKKPKRKLSSKRSGKKYKVKNIIIDKEVPKNEIPVDKPIANIHVEYELVPNKCKYHFDVICWGPVAKIFTNDGTETLKTVTQNELIWVPVCLNHYLLPLEQSEIEALHAHVIEFTVFTNKNKLGKEAKATKCKMFYTLEDDSDCNKFVKVFTENPTNKQKRNTEKELLEEDIREMLLNCSNYPTKNESVSWLHYNDTYMDKLYDIINKVTKGHEINVLHFAPKCPPPEEELDLEEDIITVPTKKKKVAKVKEKKKKPKRKAKRKKDNMNIMVPGEAFFTISNNAIYAISSNFVVAKFFAVISVKNILTREQKLFFNPIIVKVLNLSSFPTVYLQNLGFSGIFAEYKIPYIAHCKTAIQTLEVTKAKVNIYESHAFFTHNVPTIKLLEFLQTQRLLIEIYGVKTPKPEKPRPSVFGKESKDREFSKIFRNFKMPATTTKAKDTLLAVATYDLSSLVQNIWLFKEYAQCHAPGSTLFQKSKHNTKLDPIYTINNIHFNSLPNFESPLMEEKLLKACTSLKVEVYLLAPQAASLVLHGIPDTFKRIFAIALKESFAMSLICKILLHNQKMLLASRNDVITGFLLDNGNNFAFFLEGLSTGFILNLWYEIDKCNSEMCKIFLNSDHIFEKRLYEFFIESGGIYFLMPNIPFQDILKKPLIYLEGSMPNPCFQAIQKFHLLFNSSTLKSMLQFNLFPKAEELISFNIEWGVPFSLK